MLKIPARIIVWLTLSFLIGSVVAGHPASTAEARVWDVTHQWNEQWECAYSDWITTQVGTDFLEPAGLSVDCADLCYVIRAVFSRNNRLPFLASNANGSKIGHFMNRYDNLSRATSWTDDKRLLAFLRELVRHVTTKSFPYDTYPVKLTPKTVRPGLVIYENIIASHACFVSRITPTQIIPIQFFEASVPPEIHFKKARILNIYIYSEGVSRDRSGVVRWNWPRRIHQHWEFIRDRNMPFFSTDIYTPAFQLKKQLDKALNRIVVQTYREKSLDVEDVVQQLVQYFKEEVQYRCTIVNKAQSRLKHRPESFRSRHFEYAYGTFSRDERLYQLVYRIWAGIEQHDIPRQQFFAALNSVSIPIVPEKPPCNLLFLFICADRKWLSSDAYAPVGRRWGIDWDNKTNLWIFNGKYSQGRVLEWYIKSK